MMDFPREKIEPTAYKRLTGHFLTDNLKENRVVKSKNYLSGTQMEVTENYYLRVRKCLHLCIILTNKMYNI